jgi:hypothetical protein
MERTLDLIQQYSPLANVVASIILVIVTGIYVYLTKKILGATKEQSQLSLAPALGINIKSIDISKVFGPKRRNMSVLLELANVGNAPAIEILVDAEIELRYSQIKGERLISCRFEPEMISYLRPGESNEECHPNFGNSFITRFFDDVRESRRLNIHRIETDPTQESFKTSRLYVYAYYRNTIGQYFKSIYEIEIDLDPFSKDPIPDDDKEAKATMSYIPRPKFHVEPITKKTMEEEIVSRNSRRDLCGW